MVGLVSLNTGNMWIYPSYWFITNNTLNVVLKNSNSSSEAKTIGLSAGILYMLN